MTLLSPHLAFDGGNAQAGSSKDAAHALPPPGTHVVLSDSLNSPADFAVAHFVAAAAARRQPVVLVDFRLQGRQAWESLGRKLHFTIPPATSKLWTHISPSSVPGGGEPGEPALHNTEPDLKPTYRCVVDALASSTATGALVVLDGLDELLPIGFSPELVARFSRAVLARCRKTGAVLVSRLHADCLDAPGSPASPQYSLLVQLCQIAGGTWWRVGRLDSGRSGEVMGEISCHLNFPVAENASLFPVMPRSQPWQYRLADGSVKLFPKGTGRGFL